MCKLKVDLLEFGGSFLLLISLPTDHSESKDTKCLPPYFKYVYAPYTDFQRKHSSMKLIRIPYLLYIVPGRWEVFNKYPPLKKNDILSSHIVSSLKDPKHQLCLNAM